MRGKQKHAHKCRIKGYGTLMLYGDILTIASTVCYVALLVCLKY